METLKQTVLRKAHLKDSFVDNLEGFPSTQKTLDGKCVAEWLTSIGFTVTKHEDVGTNAWVYTKEGVRVSSNGYCHYVDKK